MKVLNIFDLILELFSFTTAYVHPFFLLGLFALALSFLGGLIFKRVSNQEKMGVVVNQIWFQLLELRLPNRTMGEFLRAQKQILILNFNYLLLSILPSLIIIIPIVLALVGFENYFSLRAVRPGEVFTVDIILAAAADKRPTLERERIPEALTFIEADPEFSRWVFRANSPGQFSIPFVYQGLPFTKHLVVSRTIERVSPVNGFHNWTAYLYQNNEQPLSPSLKDKLKEVRLNYRPITSPIPIFGWKMDWLSFFMLSSLVFILVTKKMLKIR